MGKVNDMKTLHVGFKDWKSVATTLWDGNSGRLWVFLVPILAYSIHSGNFLAGFLMYAAFLLVFDILNYGFAIAYFDPELVISRGYDLSVWFNETLHSVGLDYGFNFYDGDYTKTRRQAQLDKFEHAFQKLGLKPGMSVLDCGCGCGDWLYWLQTEKKLKVVGVNITPKQVEEARSRGLRVILSNWKTLDLKEHDLIGKFDAVTFWDTVEHYINSKDRHNYAKQDQVYGDMFDMAKKMLKPNSPSGKIWISCLHMKSNVAKEAPFTWNRLVQLYYCYILDKFHSGTYPTAERDQLVKAGEKLSFKLEYRKDTTMDYFMTSELEPTHFGKHVFSWTPFRLFVVVANLFLDPNAIHRMLWYAVSDWMMQFDKQDISKSDMVHWWLLFGAAD